MRFFRWMFGLPLALARWAQNTASRNAQNVATALVQIWLNKGRSFLTTLGVIIAVTQGGPATATETLVYKVYKDGFVGLDLGGSAAQSVVLMVIVIALTIVQFRFIERRVQYG